jgi:hypothetical protein
LARRPSAERIVCPRCARAVVYQADYFCACGEHNDALYRAEHASPASAAGMTRTQIQDEYLDAGRPFRRDERAEVVASAILQSVIMKTIRGGEHV